MPGKAIKIEPLEADYRKLHKRKKLVSLAEQRGWKRCWQTYFGILIRSCSTQIVQFNRKGW